MSDEVAVKIIRENAGGQFDSKIADAFLKLNDQGAIASSD